MGSKGVWMQYIDGWAQLKGENAFEAHYIRDMRAAHDVCTRELL